MDRRAKDNAMKKQRIEYPKKILFILVSLFFSFFALLVTGELVANILLPKTKYQYDPTLGWKPKANYVSKITTTDLSGEKYIVDYMTTQYGFRQFGDLSSGKARIFIIGDSFTDTHASNDETYFGILSNQLDVEVFAFGGSGYGTLQQLMVVKEFSEEIKPDIFVLQYCDNDIANNSLFLEGHSVVTKQKKFRPYWVDGAIEYRTPAKSLVRLLFEHSYMFRFADHFITNLRYRQYGGYYPPDCKAYEDWDSILSEGKTNEIVEQARSAIATTQLLMAEMARALPPETKLITFTVSTEQESLVDIWQSIAREAGFSAYTSVAMRVESAEKAGHIVRIHDGAHWNRLGNKIAGDELSRIIQQDFSDVVS